MPETCLKQRADALFFSRQNLHFSKTVDNFASLFAVKLNTIKQKISHNNHLINHLTTTK